MCSVTWNIPGSRSNATINRLIRGWDEQLTAWEKLVWASSNQLRNSFLCSGSCRSLREQSNVVVSLSLSLSSTPYSISFCLSSYSSYFSLSHDLCLFCVIFDFVKESYHSKLDENGAPLSLLASLLKGLALLHPMPERGKENEAMSEAVLKAKGYPIVGVRCQWKVSIKVWIWKHKTSRQSPTYFELLHLNELLKSLFIISFKGLCWKESKSLRISCELWRWTNGFNLHRARTAMEGVDCCSSSWSCGGWKLHVERWTSTTTTMSLAASLLGCWVGQACDWPVLKA